MTPSTSAAFQEQLPGLRSLFPSATMAELWKKYSEAAEDMDEDGDQPAGQPGSSPAAVAPPRGRPFKPVAYPGTDQVPTGANFKQFSERAELAALPFEQRAAWHQNRVGLQKMFGENAAKEYLAALRR